MRRPQPATRASRASCMLAAWLAAGCSGAFFHVTPEESAAVTRARTPAAVDTAAWVPVPAARLPESPEPAAVASDSAGVHRLIRLAMLWQTVRLHHPGVDDGAAWDAAVARMIPAIRAAGDADALSAAMETLVGVLQDPVTRIERHPSQTSDAPARDGRAAVRTEFLPGTDSVLFLRIAPAARYTPGDSAIITQAIARDPARVVIDVRGDTRDVSAHDRVTLDALLLRTGLASSLISTPLALGQRRTRVHASMPTVASGFLSRAAEESDHSGSVLLREYGTLPGAARRAVRTAIVTNRDGVLPQHLAAMVASGRAWLVSEGRAGDDVLVPSVLIPMDRSVTVRVRTGDVRFPANRDPLRADSVVAEALSPGTRSDESVRVAAALVRSTRTVPSSTTNARAYSPSPQANAPRSNTDTLPYPYMGARLLAVFRVWSIMRTRHAHRDSYDDDIDAVFERTIPRIEAAQNREQFVRALGDLITSFDDSQVRLERRAADSRADAASAPFRARVVEGRMIITSTRAGTPTPGLGVGAEITSADGYPIAAWFQEHRRDIPSSNEWARSRDLAERLPLGPQGNATFKVRDATGSERTMTVVRAARPSRDATTSGEWVAERTSPPSRTMGEIAYFDLARLDDESASRAFAGIGSARAVVLDLRGRLTVSPDLVLGRFASRAAFTAARTVSRPMSAPCLAPKFRDAARQCADERITSSILLHGDSTIAFRGRVVVLIDERTQEAAERLALGLEAGTDATMIGSASAGAAAPTVSARLPGNLTLHYPQSELRRADGGQLHRVGLTPAVDARPTVRGIRAGTDEVLDRAVAWITQQLDGSRRRR